MFGSFHSYWCNGIYGPQTANLIFLKQNQRKAIFPKSEMKTSFLSVQHQTGLPKVFSTSYLQAIHNKATTFPTCQMLSSFSCQQAASRSIEALQLLIRPVKATFPLESVPGCFYFRASIKTQVSLRYRFSRTFTRTKRSLCLLKSISLNLSWFFEVDNIHIMITLAYQFHNFIPNLSTPWSCLVQRVLQGHCPPPPGGSYW